MTLTDRHAARVFPQSALPACLLAGLLVPLLACHREAPPVEKAETTAAPTPAPTPEPSATPIPPETWAAAIEKVEERRGSPGLIEVPHELDHYEDRRRFLALQMADSKEEGYDVPHDQAELVEMIQRGELVEVRALGDDYILYDVGTAIREDPLSHYDVASGKDVKLFASLEDYQEEDARLAEEEKRPGPPGAKARVERELLASFYNDPEKRDRLFAEYEAVTDLARSFRGLTYDLDDPADRTRFQVRLLSFIRPAARDILMKLAHDYHEKFGRRLPVTSLVRTQRYQRRMVHNSPNATGVELAPHLTGMAFDVSYKFMAPDEQNFVMEQIAWLKDAGRVEALREHNNSFHVFTYADNHPPAESDVTGFLDEVEAAHPGSAPHKAVAAARGATARRSAASSGPSSRKAGAARRAHVATRRGGRHLASRSR